MATVYRVRDDKTGQKLALKRSWGRDPRKRIKRSASLEREFHTLAHLSHPRIIEVYDFGVDDDGPYYTMELLDGSDLDKSARLPWQETCALLRDIASSLAILHSRGLIHRDVSLRNVRRTADGRAKLIDFGAMMSAGVATDIVGTPPFMAPEVLQMQSLDARADLFSLGVLGYHLLSGRHAFPARKLSDLRDIWRSRPAPLARLFPEIPAPLSELILQLLSLDRGARPASASEVMERLCAIAELPKEELPEITRAYLTTPTLVGRDKALVSIRNRMLSLARGDGGVLMIEGFPGLGRSRLVDACVFDGKLLGALILRASSSDAASGDWGVARAVGSQLFDLLPKQAAEACRLSKHILGHVIEEVARDGSSTSVSMTFPEHSMILRELRDLVLGVARSQRLIIAVDDVDHIDDASAAWLAAVADKADRQQVLLVLSAEPENAQGQSTSMHLLRSLATVVSLEPLSAEQTAALMRSVFGDTANLQLCAGSIHALSHGNPLAIMDLAQHLVERGLARYEAGSWLLPARLDEGNLPTSLAESLQRRIDALGADARELAQIMCVTDGHALLPDNYRSLTAHRDKKRTFGALEELVAARVVVVSAEAHHFSQRGFVATLAATLNDKRRTQLHGRFAQLLAARGSDVMQRVPHLLYGGCEASAIRLLCSSTEQGTRLPAVAVLERAAQYAEHDSSLSARMVHHLRTAVLMKACVHLAIESFRRYLPRVLAQLEADSGLTRYRELSDVPPPERLSRALAEQQQRYLATPEHDRVFGVGDAIRELARLIGAACAMAGSMFDMELLEAMPSLEPLFPLSPALQLGSQLVQACADWIAGRGRRSMRHYEQALERMQHADRAGLDPAQYERIWLNVHYALGLSEASFGIERAEERARTIEPDRALRVNSWRLRALLHLNQGNVEAAHKCSRRAELLQLQDAAEAQFLGASTGFELRAFGLAEDLLGVKRCVDALSGLAELHPGWRPMYILGQSRYRELQGNLHSALELINTGLELSKPGRHLLYGFMAAAQVRLLRETGAVAESLEHAERYIAVCDAEELTTPGPMLRLEYALCLARGGKAEQAAIICDELIRAAHALGSTGLSLGVFYEARARVALAMGDQRSFQTFTASCAGEYRRGRSSALGAKFARLIEEGGAKGLIDSDPVREFGTLLEFEPESESNTVNSRIIECVDAPDRARCALTMLLQSTDSYLGFLYGVREAGLIPLAGFPEANSDANLEQWLLRWVQAERDVGSDVPSLATATQSEPPYRVESVEGDMTSSVDTRAGALTHEVPSTYVDAEGRRFRPALLVSDAPDGRSIAAVLALEINARSGVRPPERLLAQLADQLRENDDVTPVSFDG